MAHTSISDLLIQCYKKRSEYIHKNHLEAFRLIDNGESPAFPCAIDIYKDNAVVHVFGSTPVVKLREMEQTIHQLLNIKNFFYKNRTAQKSDVNIEAIQKDHIHQACPKNIIIEEYGNIFECNLEDYLDTGIFLDHRETRKWIQQQSKNKIVLNTFAYTGSFSIYAANGGAQKTYSVDLSKTYTEWIKRNLELNHLPLEKNWVYKMDTREFFKYAARKDLRFDIIVIDPPSFSRNKGNSFSVQKDHPELINAALEVLNPKGFILFSNNKQDFRIQQEKLTPCTIQNIQRQTIPGDYNNKNAHYCFVIRPL